MPLVHPDLTFNRSAIMQSAWGEFRSRLNRPGTPGRRSFGECLSYAWRLARTARARLADGSVQREREDAFAHEVLRRQLWASMTDQQRADVGARIVHGCSTDGRLPVERR